MNLNKGVVILALLFFQVSLIFSQNVDLELGYDLGSFGKVGVLLLFAEVDCSAGGCSMKYNCAGDPDPNDPTKWQPGQLPPDAAQWLDYQPPGTGTPTNYLTKFYHEASFGRLEIFGDYFPTVLTVPCADMVNLDDSREAALQELRNRILAGDPDFQATTNGLTLDDLDEMVNEGDHGDFKGPGSNGVIDAVAIIWRNNTEFSSGSGLAFDDGQGAVIFFPTPHGNTTSNIVGSWSDNQGNGFGLFIAEFLHPLLGGNNWHTGWGAGRHTFPFRTSIHGICSQGDASSTAVCGWDRYSLRWYNELTD
jgi:hypothetical protein